MPSGNTDSYTGKLKILAGPDVLLHLLERAARECAVTVGDGVLRWSGDKGSPGGTVPGDRIQSVTQHDCGFVVHLRPSGNGVNALTFGAASSADAANWVEAVKRIGAASATQSEPAAVGTAAAPASDPTPISLKYSVGGKTTQKDYALLVIACEPRSLVGICDYTSEELATFQQFHNYTFHTTLMKVKTPSQAQDHAVVFAPASLDRMDGSVYAYRNESAKKFGLKPANGMAENLVAIYQLAKSPTMTADQFQTLLLNQLKSSSWWPFGQDFEILDTVTTPYFDRFEASSLEKGLPWEILERQGQRHTLLVHASACFESALHCWTYANLLESVPAAKQALPKNLSSPIVVLGAGVSGILFAAKLKWLGYTHIDILENTDRYGGKTHTLIEDGPYPPNSHEKTVCELGTCYLSPAYAPMVNFLQQHGVLKGNDQIDFTQGDPSFRGIVTAGELPPSFNAPAVMDYSKYVILKAESELGWNDSDLNRLFAQFEIASALAKYSVLHIEYMGWDMPMPSTPPPAPLLTQTFYEFLSANDLLALVGVLQYGYEVQGYGPLQDIPAYYGLAWITPAITWAVLLDALGVTNTPVVTAWTQGWGNVWEQIVDTLKLNITYSAQTTAITRSSVAGIATEAAQTLAAAS
jgi:hypothetical protein